MAIGDVTLNEGNGGTTPFTFTVTLSNPSSTPVSASWATADGTTANPSDYATASGTVLFSPGDVSETITISVVGDTVPEPDETFVVGLSGAAGATIGDSQGTGTILNEDAAAASAVPALSEWMLIALAGLLVAVAASKVR